MTLLNCLCFCKFRLIAAICRPGALLLTATNIFLHMATYKLLRLFFNSKYKSDIIRMLAFYKEL